MDENHAHAFQNVSPVFLNDQNHDDDGTVEKETSKRFGNVSEETARVSEMLWKDAEDDIPAFRRPTKSSEKIDKHLLTVRESAKIFEDAKLPITERSIINWCHQNKRGECRLGVTLILTMDCLSTFVEGKNIPR